MLIYHFHSIHRLTALKELVDNISIQFYESLKHLMHHLFLVSQNCQINLMEPKNLAIIFGPSVVRSCNETLEIVVKDMKHQCRIVEALVSHVNIFLSSFFPFNFHKFTYCNHLFSMNTFSKMAICRRCANSQKQWLLRKHKRTYCWIMCPKLNVST